MTNTDPTKPGTTSRKRNPAERSTDVPEPLTSDVGDGGSDEEKLEEPTSEPEGSVEAEPAPPVVPKAADSPKEVSSHAEPPKLTEQPTAKSRGGSGNVGSMRFPRKPRRRAH
jgi:hypothetical protein